MNRIIAIGLSVNLSVVNHIDFPVSLPAVDSDAIC